MLRLRDPSKEKIEVVKKKGKEREKHVEGRETAVRPIQQGTTF